MLFWCDHVVANYRPVRRRTKENSELEIERKSKVFFCFEMKLFYRSFKNNRFLPKWPFRDAFFFNWLQYISVFFLVFYESSLQLECFSSHNSISGYNSSFLLFMNKLSLYHYRPSLSTKLFASITLAMLNSFDTTLRTLTLLYS